MRALGLDLGTKRIGVAVTDISGTIASPHSVIGRSKSVRHDHQVIAKLVRDEEVELVVVGLPITMSGEHGPAAQAATREARLLATVLSVPVEMFDERMTTVTADRVLREAEIRASDRRRHVDKIAAAVMLQTWLERRRS